MDQRAWYYRVEGRFLIIEADPTLDESFRDALKAIKSDCQFQIEVRADYIEGLKRSDYQLGLSGIKSGRVKLDDEFDL